MSRPESATATVLLAEDAAVIRVALTQVLADRGYHVIGARDGEEAVRLARSELPDAILMDIAMPKLDGVAALEALRADPATREIAIAAATAVAMGEERRRVEAADFDMVLTKPYEVPELLHALEALLQLSRSSDLPIDA